VEIRKLIECEEDGRYPVLTFFCDWILHDRMDRKNARAILWEFDTAIDDLRSGRLGVPAVVKRLSPLISLETFQHDLFIILGQHGLDTELIGKLSRLGTFLGLYVDIISKTPLRTDDPSLRFLNNIHITKSREPVAPSTGQGETFVFGIQWSLRKDDVEALSFCNEIWLPKNPSRYKQTVVRLINRGGKLKSEPLESKSFLG
jgi:hypothetical protein